MCGNNYNGVIETASQEESYSSKGITVCPSGQTHLTSLFPGSIIVLVVFFHDTSSLSNTKHSDTPGQVGSWTARMGSLLITGNNPSSSWEGDGAGGDVVSSLLFLLLSSPLLVFLLDIILIRGGCCDPLDDRVSFLAVQASEVQLSWEANPPEMVGEELW